MRFAMPIMGEGVQSLRKTGATKLAGDVVLAEGANVTLTQTDQQIAIAAAGGTVTLFLREVWLTAHGFSQAEQGVTTPGTVYLSPIDLISPAVIDAILVAHGVTTGETVRAGVYRDDGTLTKPDGTALVVESGAVVAPTASATLVLPVADTTLTKGRYWVGIESDGGLRAWFYLDNLNPFTSFIRAGGFGAFPTPCPATTPTFNGIYVGVRVKTNIAL